MQEGNMEKVEMMKLSEIVAAPLTEDEMNNPYITCPKDLWALTQQQFVGVLKWYNILDLCDGWEEEKALMDHYPVSPDYENIPMKEIGFRLEDYPEE
jgi:hypothetical protein